MVSKKTSQAIRRDRKRQKKLQDETHNLKDNKPKSCQYSSALAQAEVEKLKLEPGSNFFTPKGDFEINNTVNHVVEDDKENLTKSILELEDPITPIEAVVTEEPKSAKLQSVETATEKIVASDPTNIIADEASESPMDSEAKSHTPAIQPSEVNPPTNKKTCIYRPVGRYDFLGNVVDLRMLEVAGQSLELYPGVDLAFAVANIPIADITTSVLQSMVESEPTEDDWMIMPSSPSSSTFSALPHTPELISEVETVQPDSPIESSEVDPQPINIDTSGIITTDNDDMEYDEAHDASIITEIFIGDEIFPADPSTTLKVITDAIDDVSIIQPPVATESVESVSLTVETDSSEDISAEFRSPNSLGIDSELEQAPIVEADQEDNECYDPMFDLLGLKFMDEEDKALFLEYLADNDDPEALEMKDAIMNGTDRHTSPSEVTVILQQEPVQKVLEPSMETPSTDAELVTEQDSDTCIPKDVKVESLPNEVISTTPEVSAPIVLATTMEIPSTNAMVVTEQDLVTSTLPEVKVESALPTVIDSPPENLVDTTQELSPAQQIPESLKDSQITAASSLETASKQAQAPSGSSIKQPATVDFYKDIRMFGIADLKFAEPHMRESYMKYLNSISDVEASQIIDILEEDNHTNVETSNEDSTDGTFSPLSSVDTSSPVTCDDIQSSTPEKEEISTITTEDDSNVESLHDISDDTASPVLNVLGGNGSDTQTSNETLIVGTLSPLSSVKLSSPVTCSDKQSTATTKDEEPTNITKVDSDLELQNVSSHAVLPVLTELGDNASNNNTSNETLTIGTFYPLPDVDSASPRTGLNIQPSTVIKVEDTTDIIKDDSNLELLQSIDEGTEKDTTPAETTEDDSNREFLQEMYETNNTSSSNIDDNDADIVALSSNLNNIFYGFIREMEHNEQVVSDTTNKNQTSQVDDTEKTTNTIGDSHQPQNGTQENNVSSDDAKEKQIRADRRKSILAKVDFTVTKLYKMVTTAEIEAAQEWKLLEGGFSLGYKRRQRRGIRYKLYNLPHSSFSEFMTANANRDDRAAILYLHYVDRLLATNAAIKVSAPEGGKSDAVEKNVGEVQEISLDEAGLEDKEPGKDTNEGSNGEGNNPILDTATSNEVETVMLSAFSAPIFINTPNGLAISIPELPRLTDGVPELIEFSTHPELPNHKFAGYHNLVEAAYCCLIYISNLKNNADKANPLRRLGLIIQAISNLAPHIKADVIGEDAGDTLHKLRMLHETATVATNSRVLIRAIRAQKWRLNEQMRAFIGAWEEVDETRPVVGTQTLNEIPGNAQPSASSGRRDSSKALDKENSGKVDNTVRRTVISRKTGRPEVVTGTIVNIDSPPPSPVTPTQGSRKRRVISSLPRGLDPSRFSPEYTPSPEEIARIPEEVAALLRPSPPRPSRIIVSGDDSDSDDDGSVSHVEDITRPEDKPVRKQYKFGGSGSIIRGPSPSGVFLPTMFNAAGEIAHSIPLKPRRHVGGGRSNAERLSVSGVSPPMSSVTESQSEEDERATGVLDLQGTITDQTDGNTGLLNLEGASVEQTFEVASKSSSSSISEELTDIFQQTLQESKVDYKECLYKRNNST